MNDKAACAKGLIFTGVYESSYNKEQLTERLNDLRRDYPKAKFYKVTAEGGISIYATPAYSAYQTIEASKKIISNHDDALRQVKERYHREIIELDNRLKEALSRMTEAEVTLAKV